MRIFVSHAASDRAWARLLRESLKGLGIEAWIAADEVLRGDNVASATGRALETADAMLVLISPDSVRSEPVLDELGFALGSLKYEHRVIPVIVQPTDEIPWILRTFRQVTGTPAEAARRVAEILSALSTPAPARAGTR